MFTYLTVFFLLIIRSYICLACVPALPSMTVQFCSIVSRLPGCNLYVTEPRNFFVAGSEIAAEARIQKSCVRSQELQTRVLGTNLFFGRCVWASQGRGPPQLLEWKWGAGSGWRPVAATCMLQLPARGGDRPCPWAGSPVPPPPLLSGLPASVLWAPGESESPAALRPLASPPCRASWACGPRCVIFAVSLQGPCF